MHIGVAAVSSSENELVLFDAHRRGMLISLLLLLALIKGFWIGQSVSAMFVGLIFSVAAVGVGIAIAGQLFPNRPLVQLTAGSLLLFNPRIGLVGSQGQADPWFGLLALALLWLVIQDIRAPTVQSKLNLAISAVIGVYIDWTFLALLPIVAAGLATGHYRKISVRTDGSSIARTIVAPAAAVIAVLLPFYLIFAPDVLRQYVGITSYIDVWYRFWFHLTHPWMLVSGQAATIVGLLTILSVVGLVQLARSNRAATPEPWKESAERSGELRPILASLGVVAAIALLFPTMHPVFLVPVLLLTAIGLAALIPPRLEAHCFVFVFAGLLELNFQAVLGGTVRGIGF